MNTILGTWHWLTTAEHYRGTAGVPHRLLEHVVISGIAVGLAVLIALPLGLWLGHVGHGGAVAINVSNIGRAIPTFAILVLLATVPSLFGDAGAVLALLVFAIPPILTNAYVGMREVDPDVREAAVGMAWPVSPWCVAWSCHLPCRWSRPACGPRPCRWWPLRHSPPMSAPAGWAASSPTGSDSRTRR